MAGSKTRFGFLGGGDEPPDSGESGAARTIIGHDIHLQKLPTGFEPSRPLGSPTPLPPTPLPAARVPYSPVRPAAVVAPMPEAITESVPVRRHYRPRQSRLARLFGRWSTGGQFHSRSNLEQATVLDEPDDSDWEVPRNTTGRNVVLVLGIAVFTFLVTFAIVRIRQRSAPAQPVAGAQAVERQTVAPPSPMQPAPVPTSPAPTKPPALPAPPAPTEKPVLLGTPVTTPPVPTHPLAKTPTPAQPSASKDSPRLRKPARTAVPTGQPPDHLKGELLPLAP